MLTVDPSFIACIPKFVLGSLLLYLGASLMYEWLVDAARRISLLEYGSLLAIALLNVQFGYKPVCSSGSSSVAPPSRSARAA